MTNCVLFSFYNLFGYINLKTVTSSEIHKCKCPSYVDVKRSCLHYTPWQSSTPLNVQFISNLMFKLCIDMTSLNNNQLMHSKFNIY